MIDLYTDLNAFVEEYRHKPFAWGTVDCMQVAREWAKRATGADPCPDLKEYTTALGAVRVLKELGYDSLEDALDANFERREPTFAQRGDLALFKSAESNEFPTAVGICCGADSLFLGEKGLIFSPTNQCIVFWKVS